MTADLNLEVFANLGFGKEEIISALKEGKGILNIAFNILQDNIKEKYFITDLVSPIIRLITNPKTKP